MIYLHAFHIMRFVTQGFFTPFASEVRSCCSSIVSASVEVYTRVCTELLPTPAKFHYTFNLRDLSRVVQGIMSISPVKCTTSETVTRLWVHEIVRTFGDRLVSATDRSWFEGVVLDLLHRSFRVSWTREQVCCVPICALVLFDPRFWFEHV